MKEKEEKMSWNRMLQVLVLVASGALLFAKVKGDQYERIKAEYGEETMKEVFVRDYRTMMSMGDF